MKKRKNSRKLNDLSAIAGGVSLGDIRKVAEGLSKAIPKSNSTSKDVFIEGDNTKPINTHGEGQCDVTVEGNNNSTIET